MKKIKTLMIAIAAIFISYSVSAAAGDTIKLTLNAIHGQITVSPVKDLYAVGDVLTLTAIPNTNYTFVTWTDGTGVPLSFDAVQPNPIQWTLDQFNSTFNAIFVSNNPCEQQYDLLNNKQGEWQVNSDATGNTSIQLDTAFGTATPVKVTYNIGKATTPDSYDTYASALVSIVDDTIMSGFNAISISYTSDQPLFLIIPSSVLLENTGEGYYVDLPVTATAIDTTISVGVFHQPDWTAVADFVSLNIDSINQIDVQPNVDVTAASKSGSFTITKLKICWSTQIVGMHELNKNDLSEININGLWNGNIYITASKADNYDVSIYAVDGKEVYSKNAKFNEGLNQVQFQSTLENGIYFIKVSNDKASAVKKVALLK